MIFFELEAVDISSLNDSDLRDLVARLCEAELIQQGIPPSGVTWGGAQEAADGGLDVSIRTIDRISNANFVLARIPGFKSRKTPWLSQLVERRWKMMGNPKHSLKT